ncbi:hypothetical protein HKD37_18G051611 [Glycine soja]
MKSRENISRFHFGIKINYAGIGDRSVLQPWYDFLIESDFDHGDEVSFYYQCHEKIWEIVIRRQKNWDDSDTD